MWMAGFYVYGLQVQTKCSLSCQRSTLRYPPWRRSTPSNDLKFSRSRQSRYRCCDSLLCASPLLMVYNLTPWYHGCSNSTTVDHFTSMETSQRHFMIVPGAFLGNVLNKESRPTWDQKSARVDRMWLFCVGWVVQVRHRRSLVWFRATPKHHRHLLRI